MVNRFRGSLEDHGVPLPPDFDERMDLMIKGLRRDPEFDEHLQAYKKQAGGQMPRVIPDPDDFIGPKLKWFIDGISSPLAQMVWKTVFSFVFFISYLEATPLFGSVLSAALDVMLAGGKILTKMIQTNLPAVMGLIPLPWASVFGLLLATVFGMIMWPMLALVSLSRQDFAFAIDSFVRIIPPPFGTTIADLFMDTNRTVARLNQKRAKLGEDLSNAFSKLGETLEGVSDKAKQGTDVLAKRVSEVSASDTFAKAKTMGTNALSKAKEQGAAALQTAGKSLSRRTKKKDKWHRTTRRRFVTR